MICPDCGEVLVKIFFEQLSGGNRGEIYPCKSDIFEYTYEKVKEL